MENKTTGICYICGEPLVWDENDENCYAIDFEDDEGTIQKTVRCAHCGTLYQYYINNDTNSDSEEDYVTCGDQGFGNCAMCGGTVVWSGDFMRSDYFDGYDEQTNEDDDAIVRSMVCGHCGCQMEVWEPTPNEMKSGKYPYWNE